MGGLGQFADLRWGLGKKDGGVFEGGGGVDTPRHTMDLDFFLHAPLCMNST